MTLLCLYYCYPTFQQVTNKHFTKGHVCSFLLVVPFHRSLPSLPSLPVRLPNDDVHVFKPTESVEIKGNSIQSAPLSSMAIILHFATCDQCSANFFFLARTAKGNFRVILSEFVTASVPFHITSIWPIDIKTLITTALREGQGRRIWMNWLKYMIALLRFSVPVSHVVKVVNSERGLLWLWLRTSLQGSNRKAVQTAKQIQEGTTVDIRLDWWAGQEQVTRHRYGWLDANAMNHLTTLTIWQESGD